ncbi:MAG: DUF3800 domain-containing protein [Pseudomonadota bacterium]
MGEVVSFLDAPVIVVPMKLPNDPNSLPTLSFFGDSSSRMSNFMVLGGLAVAGHRLAEIETQIADIRERGRIRSEFHWKEYRGGSKQKSYEELCRFGFGLVNTKKAALHVMVADFRKFDHKREEGQTRDTSINKLYWLLCLHRLAKFYGEKRAIHIRLDSGDDCSHICTMRNQLSAAAFRKFKARPNCIRSIEPMSSEKSGLIQLSDVLLGGIASQLNGNRGDTCKGKLAEYIRKTSGRHSWSTSTPAKHRFLTVWHYQQ